MITEICIWWKPGVGCRADYPVKLDDQCFWNCLSQVKRVSCCSEAGCVWWWRVWLERLNFVYPNTIDATTSQFFPVEIAEKQRSAGTVRECLPATLALVPGQRSCSRSGYCKTGGCRRPLRICIQRWKKLTIKQNWTSYALNELKSVPNNSQVVVADRQRLINGTEVDVGEIKIND